MSEGVEPRTVAGVLRREARTSHAPSSKRSLTGAAPKDFFLAILLQFCAFFLLLKQFGYQKSLKISRTSRSCPTIKLRC